MESQEHSLSSKNIPKLAESPSTEQQKEQIPQLNPETHISNDYVNEVNAFLGFLHLGLNFLKKHYNSGILEPIKLYQERYPEEKYHHVVTPENEERITTINNSVRKINAMLLDLDQIQEEELIRELEKIVALIRGTEET